MKRRDLNPGDVFVYLEVHDQPVHRKPVLGELRYVYQGSTPPWIPGVQASGGPNDMGGVSWLTKETLDLPVLLIQKPGT